MTKTLIKFEKKEEIFKFLKKIKNKMEKFKKIQNVFLRKLKSNKEFLHLFEKI